MWESLFTPEVIGAVIAGLFSLIATLIALRANRKSDKVGEQLLELRFEPYKELWSLTLLPSLTPEEGLTPERRKELSSKLRSWYFEKGGIVLSHEARHMYFEAVKLLVDDDPNPADEEIKEKLSRLRNQIAEDLGTSA